MIPSTIVEHDKSGLEKVLAALQELLEDHFIEGIRCKHRTLYEIEQTLEMVRIYQHRVNIEGKALVKFSENFIRHYATDNNKCFDTAEVLFTKIKSTIKSLREVFYKTTCTDRRPLPAGKEAPSVFEKSALVSEECQKDAFGLESFPKPVQELYYALDTLFTTSATHLALCHLMIEEEAKTRNDIVRLRQIYDESCNELLDTVKSVSAYIKPSQELPENEMDVLHRKVGVKNIDEFLKEGYHRYDKNVFTQYLVIKTIREARNNGLTEIEAFYWRKNPEKALQAREVIARFDEIEGAEGEKGSLDSTTLVRFLKWCNVEESQERGLYESYFKPQYSAKGMFKPLGWNTISGRRKKLRDMGKSDEILAAGFVKALSQLSLAGQR